MLENSCPRTSSEPAAVMTFSQWSSGEAVITDIIGPYSIKLINELFSHCVEIHMHPENLTLQQDVKNNHKHAHYPEEITCFAQGWHTKNTKRTRETCTVHTFQLFKVWNSSWLVWNPQPLQGELLKVPNRALKCSSSQTDVLLHLSALAASSNSLCTHYYPDISKRRSTNDRWHNAQLRQGGWDEGWVEEEGEEVRLGQKVEYNERE